MMDGHVTRTSMALLLLVFLCVVSTTADESAPAVIKMVVSEGDDAVLNCSFGSRSVKQELFDWKKDGQKEVFMYDRGTHYNNNPTNQDQDFRGRVFHFPQELDVGNASVVIRATKVTDSGSYTCDFPFHQPRRRSHIVLVVGAAPKPYVTILNETKDWVLLKCEVNGAFPKPRVEWQDGNKNTIPSEEPKVVDRGDRYDVILRATVTKTDHYRCVATQDKIKHQSHEDIFVLLNGAAPEPNFKTLGETDSGVQLQCSVKGASPKPKVHWQDRSGNIVSAEEPQVSERGGSYDIILQTTVTKTNYYQCVATQEEINHRVYTETYVIVPVHGGNTGMILVGVFSFLGGVIAVVAVAAAFFCRKKAGNKQKTTSEETKQMKSSNSASACLDEPGE